MGRHGGGGGKQMNQPAPAAESNMNDKQQQSAPSAGGNRAPVTGQLRRTGDTAQTNPLSSLLNVLGAAGQSSATTTNINHANEGSANQFGGRGNSHSNVPPWHNNTIHVWKKDSITIINMRDDSEILHGLEDRMRMRQLSNQARHAAREKQHVGQTLSQPAAAPHRGAVEAIVHKTEHEALPQQQQQQGNNVESGISIQSFLNDQLAKMRDSEQKKRPSSNVPPAATTGISNRAVFDSGNASALPMPGGSRATPPARTTPPPQASQPQVSSTTAPRTTPQPAPVSLYSDPLWSAGSAWDGVPATAAPKAEDQISVDFLSGILGDLKGEAAAAAAATSHLSVDALSAATSATPSTTSPQAAPSTPPSQPSSVMQLQQLQQQQQQQQQQQVSPQRPATMTALPMWTVASSGMQPQQMPTMTAMPQTVGMFTTAGPGMQSFVPVQRYITGYPAAMGAQQVFVQPGMQILQAPPGWTIQQGKPAQMQGTPVILNYPAAPVSMVAAKMPVSGGYPKMPMPQTQQQQQQQQRFSVTAAPQPRQQDQSADASGSRNPASANGVNVGAAPFVPKTGN